MARKHTGEYPANWLEIAKNVKELAGWRCVRCNHPHEPETGYTLTVHHLDMNASNCEWWNIPALCQRCHLEIQSKVVIERMWAFEHSRWFKPYLAGYYAHRLGLSESRYFCTKYADEIIKLAEGKMTMSDFTVAIIQKEPDEDA